MKNPGISLTSMILLLAILSCARGLIAQEGAVKEEYVQLVFARYQADTREELLQALFIYGGAGADEATQLSKALMDGDKDWATGVLSQGDADFPRKIAATYILHPAQTLYEDFLEPEVSASLGWKRRYIASLIQWTMLTEKLPACLDPTFCGQLEDGLDEQQIDQLRATLVEYSNRPDETPSFFMDALPLYLSTNDDLELMKLLWDRALPQTLDDPQDGPRSTLASRLMFVLPNLKPDSQAFSYSLQRIVPQIQELEREEALGFFSGAMATFQEQANSGKVQLVIWKLVRENPGGLYADRAELIGLLHRSPSPVSPESAWHQQLQDLYERELADLEAAAKLLEP